MEKSNSYIGILVTGSSGQLGKTISELYKDQNNLRFHFKSKSELDITQLSDLEKFFQHHQIDFIINCAAYTNVEDAEVRRVKAQKVNSSGVLNLVNVSRKHNTKLIHISTDYVFDGIKKTPYTENDIPNPLNYYGITKLMGESIIKDADVDYYIIRTSWLYSKFENNFFTFITNALTQNKEIQITTSQKGVPTSVKSLSKFLIFLIKNSKDIPFGTYNYVDDGIASWYDFAFEIARNYYPSKTQIIKAIDVYATKAVRPNYSVLSNSKIKKFYTNILPWQEILKDTLN